MLRRYLADGDSPVAYAPDPEDEDQEEGGEPSDPGSIPGANENVPTAGDYGTAPGVAAPSPMQPIPGAIGITASGAPTFGSTAAPPPISAPFPPA